MRIKKWLCVVLAMALLSAPINLSYSESKPILGVEAGDAVVSLEAGKKGEFALNVKNIANTVAQNIRVTLKGNHPFRSDVGNLTQTFTFLNPNVSKALLYSVSVSPLSDPKLYEFEVLIEYEDVYGNAYSVTEKAYVKVTNGLTKPTVSLVESKTGLESLAPGVPDGLVLTLKNSGEIAAEEVKVSITGMSNSGVLLYKDADIKYVGSIGANGIKKMYFNIISGNKATQGTTELKVKVEYLDAYGGTYSKDFAVYVNLDGNESAKPKVVLENLVVTQPMPLGGEGSVTAEVVNKGQDMLKNIEIACELPTGFYAKSASVIPIEVLKPGEKIKVKFDVGTEADLKKGSYHGALVIRTPDPTDASKKIESKTYLGFLIEAEKAQTNRPRLIIEHYDTGDQMVMTGEPFTLKLQIKNTSLSEAVKNVKLNFTSTDNQFITVETSSAMYIDEIAPGGTKMVAIKLKPNKNTVPGAYAMTLDMEFEDSEGKAYDVQNKPYAEKELINLEVGQDVRLEVGDLTFPSEVNAGENFYLEQEFYNMGKAKIANILIKQEGLESQEGSMFLGELLAGSKDTYTAECYVEEAGTYEGKVIYQFEDAYGQMKTIEKTFKIIAKAPKPVVDLPETQVDANEKVTKKEATVELWHVLVAFGIIVGGLMLLRGKKKKKHQ